MSATECSVTKDDPILDTDFIKEMVKQMRALDTRGTYDDWSVTRILSPFLLTKERKKEIPLIGDPDKIILSRVRAFYNAIASLIKMECGLMAVPMIVLSHEGFGCAVITTGKLVVMNKALRDVHRFGFPNLSEMKDEADKLLSVALEIIGKYPEVAGM
ncbi:MAG TPA: NifX-associated nitrogen fixation protein [Acidiferrobacteraceae bacterium]|nr:NifX-associated nitrogen fixation protein [Acidiferrobacteraceae bacterium]HEX19257.1 NifX-associated nitrogen fixation protein [Acidiferrobacteraceae bacterium]